MRRKFCLFFFVMVLLNSFIYVVNANEIKFSDVSDNHWAKTSIENLSSRGTLSGYEDGTFKPDKMITRAEAAKILMTTFKASDVYLNVVMLPSDVSREHWAAEYTVNGKYYMLHSENENFRPDEIITRGDFAFALNNMIDDNLPQNVSATKIFSDISNVDLNYDAIISLANHGLINGFEDNTFRPNDGLTRAQVCKIIDDAYNYLMKRYTTEMKEKGGWATYNIENHTFSEVREDKEGKLMVYTGNLLQKNDLYYNGEYIASPNLDLTPVYEENITTSDNKKWTIKWFGDDVIEIKEISKKYTIIDNYSGLSKTYDNEYIPYEEIIKAFKYFTNKDPEIRKLEDEDKDFLTLNGYSGIYLDTKIIDGKKCASISCIDIMLIGLYKSEGWTGLDLKTIEKNKISNEEINENTSSKVELDIPGIPTESFASQVVSDSKKTAYTNEVRSINIDTFESIDDEVTRPVYYRLRNLYSGEEAEQIVENYNNNIDKLLNYERQIQDGNLYCILFDIDLKDYYFMKEGYSFAALSFMRPPQITVYDITNSDKYKYTAFGSIMPNEPEKSLYHTGDLTQMFVVFETPKDVEATALDINFINDDDYSFETFFISYLL